MALNGSEWLRMAQNGSEWLRMAQNDLKIIEKRLILQTLSVSQSVVRFDDVQNASEWLRMT